MKIQYYLPVVIGLALNLCSCASSDYDPRPIPGTVGATDTKKNPAQNNTPQFNHTPNPEPRSNPPGPDSDRVIVNQ